MVRISNISLNATAQPVHYANELSYPKYQTEKQGSRADISADQRKNPTDLNHPQIFHVLPPFNDVFPNPVTYFRTLA